MSKARQLHDKLCNSLEEPLKRFTIDEARALNQDVATAMQVTVMVVADVMVCKLAGALRRCIQLGVTRQACAELVISVLDKAGIARTEILSVADTKVVMETVEAKKAERDGEAKTIATELLDGARKAEAQ